MYESRFKRLDIDEDGYLSKNEYLYLSRLPRNEAETENKKGEVKASSSELDRLPSPNEIPLDVAELEFRTFDADKDGRISWEEKMAVIEHIYALDANEDGKIERSEFLESYRSSVGGDSESNNEE